MGHHIMNKLHQLDEWFYFLPMILVPNYDQRAGSFYGNIFTLGILRFLKLNTQFKGFIKGKD